MRGLIVYARADAAQNGAFIQKSLRAAARRGMELTLHLTDEPLTLPPDCTFALARTREPEFSARLEAMGLRVYNTSAVNALCCDKRKTYAALRSSVPMLPTRCCTVGAPPPPFAFPCVFKPALGHGGAGVRLLQNEADYDSALRTCPEAVVQPLADAGRDKRLYMLRGEILCAMLRENPNDFRSNYKLGGSARAVSVTSEERAIARRVYEAYAPDYIGVDIIYKDGAPLLNELEDPVGARMVYENTDVDIVERLFDYIQTQEEA